MAKGKTIKMTDAEGKPVEINEDDMASCSFVKQLQDQFAAELEKAHGAKADGAKKDLSADERAELLSLREKYATNVTSLREEIDSLKTARAEDQKVLKLREAKERVDALVRAGKLRPAEREFATTLCLKDEAMFKTFESTRSKILKLADDTGYEPHGTGQDTGDQSAVDELMSLVADQRKADPKLTAEEAWTITCREHRDLYENYRAETAQKV